MYVQQKGIRKVRSALTPRRIGTAILIFLIILSLIIGYMYWNRAKQQEFKNKRSLFEKLIKSYAPIKVATSPDRVSYFVQSFKFDTTMLSPEELGADPTALVWYADSSTFHDLCSTVYGMMALTIAPGQMYYKSEDVWKIIKHFIRQVEAKLPSVPGNYAFPWGNNWYQFSITYPLFLVSATYLHRHLFKRDDEFMVRHLSSYISNYFKDPPKADGMLSMGWKRDGPNAVMMAVPYIGGHLFMNDYNEKATGMQYVQNYVSLKFVTDGNGFYPDATFVFHTELRAFGYVTSAYPDFVLISEFFGRSETVRAINFALSKTEHPTIPLHFGPWFTRQPNLGTSFGRLGKLGFFTMDHMRGVVAKTEKYTIGFNGQHPRLCYYESDNSNYSWAQYWVMSRRHLYMDSPKKIFRPLLPFYPGVWSYSLQAIDIKSNTSTTNTFLPEAASCIICHYGDEAVLMRNKYMINMVGFPFDTTELTMVTRAGIHCMYNHIPDVNQAATNPLTVGVQVDHLPVKEEPLAGEGAENGRMFRNSSSYVYPGLMGIVHTREIEDPENANKKLTALYMEPRLNPAGMSCGFSNLHTESGHNELIRPATVNLIETGTFTGLNPVDHPELLVLVNRINKRACVSQDMGPIYRDDLSIPKKTLDEIFEPGYDVENASFISNSYKLTITNGRKYQAILTNAVLKTNTTSETSPDSLPEF